MPPFWMVNFGSGKTSRIESRDTTPNPLHLGHMPLGELNEKLFGSGASNEIPDSGHIRLALK